MSAHEHAIAALRRLADALEANGAATDVDVTINDRVITASIDEVRGLLDAIRPRRIVVPARAG